MNKRTLYLTLGILLSLSLLRIGMSAKLATTGAELARIDSETKFFLYENRYYEEQISELSSFRHINVKAKAEGYIPATKIVSLIQEEVPVALNNSF